ncbi:MAG: bifunctional phosphoribosylaminoimidazolecarboxamide formyltransferase/IMP cyclohydrolase [Planctomycetes bacterium]|nr:bifunctional phosphoribosylaminoimidazolecarboxamide formyltransferase/IMP cyclohydrolase [Planctomycetota bacterium]
MDPNIERALISVSDKTGLDTLARRLAARGVELYSTGGTRKFLESLGLTVYDVAAYTGFPEMMDGRIKTLHPKIHGGILARRDNPEDLAAMREHGIRGFELLVVNLYPFAATVAKPGVTDAECIENIDIGGPSLIRAAAKNHAFITVVTEPGQYSAVADAVDSTGATTYELRRQFAAVAFANTAKYDGMIAGWFARSSGEAFPQQLSLSFERRDTLRYGENPHQQAALYAEPTAASDTLVNAQKLNGKELSYNNLLDLDSALAIVRALPGPAVSVIKHNNPCGAAEAERLADAARRALDGDPVSAFGSVLGINRPVDVATAEELSVPGQFIEAIVAPSFEPAALELLTTKPKWKANVRLIAVGKLSPAAPCWDFRRVVGGLLVQSADNLADDTNGWKVVTSRAPDDAQLRELRFGWELVRHVKSNAIVVSRDRALAGVGAGQMSRVDSVKIALEKAGERAAGAILASDAFFPFADSIPLAAQAGVKAIIQPGGSKSDNDVIAACNELGLTMIFTGCRHFKH